MFAPTSGDSHLLGIKQSEIFKTLVQNAQGDFQLANQASHLQDATEKICIIAAVENASAFCDETIAIEEGIKNLEQIIQNVSKLFYISLTHHVENRFGGGNNALAGLKDDGKRVLEFIHGKHISLDLSHASDALAHDSINYIDKHRLDISIIASHSNFRPIHFHNRNLPDEIAKEIIKRKGLIGMNFLRAFVCNENPDMLYKHIEYGLELGGSKALCYGADYFHTASHPDQSRVPFFHPEHASAEKYPSISAEIATRFGQAVADDISHNNACNFLINQKLLSA